MANLHLDNFGHYGGATANLTWMYVSESVSGFQPDRWGVSNGAVELGGAGDALNIALGAAPATVVSGFAFKPVSWVAGFPFFDFIDGSVIHVGGALTLGGQIFLWRGTTATVLATSASSLTASQWRYLEAKTFINDLTGTFEVKVDGVSYVSFTGDTRNAGNAQVTNMRFTSTGGCVAYYCDWYINDTTGANNNDYLGDLRVAELYPNGPGSSTQFAVTGAAANWQAVDESSPDGDTTYVQDAVVNDKDLYTFQDVASPTIYAARLLLLGKKTDAGARSAAGTCKSGATNSDGTTTALSTDYLYVKALYATDPNTGAAWTQTNLNAAEWGPKIIS